MTARAITKFVVWHCSATRPGLDIGAHEIREWHLSRGFDDIGYHLVIRRDGTLETGRSLDSIGAHVAGHNADSVGICMVGGLDQDGQSVAQRPDLFTAPQWETFRTVHRFMRALYPHAQHVGHRELSPDLDGNGKIEQREWLKTCPGFDVTQAIARL